MSDDRTNKNFTEAMLTLVILVSLNLHMNFRISGFGETDAARLAVQAAIWERTGELPAIGYTVRTSPLYLQSLRGLLAFGVVEKKLPICMWAGNMLLGSFAIVPLYFIWRKVSSGGVAALAILLYSFMPAFWLGNTYGMPHMPAFFFFLCGLWCFSVAVGKATPQAVLLFIASMLLAAIGIGLKADIILCYGAFLWFALWAKPVSLRNVAWACIIPVVSLLATMADAQLIAPHYVSAQEWNQSFPFTIEAVTNIENLAVLVMTAGIVLSLTITASVAYCLVLKRHLGLLTLAMFWSAPLILFWGLKMGNSARHMMASYAPLALIVAVVLISCLRNRKVLTMAIIMLLLANYFVSPSFSLPRTGRPSSRFLLAAEHIQARVDNWHQTGKEFAALPDEKKVLYGQDCIIYAMWETITCASSLGREEGGQWSVIGEGGTQRVKFVYLPPNHQPPAAESGWRTYLWKDDGLRSSISEVAGAAAP